MIDVEDRLRGYRPPGPPPDLRARVMQAADSARPIRLRDWLPALAAAALIFLLSALSYRMHAQLDARLAVPDDLKPVEQWGLPGDSGELR
jgi:hypothetical protein